MATETIETTQTMQTLETTETMQRIQALMVAGGYLRAGLPSVSPLDKINGGLIWLVNASNADADLDLFYDQHSDLHRKLKVGEAIEVALQKMDCPYPLQAHQIQGLDYQAIYVVVQWLVKTFLTAQGMRSDQMHRASRWYLNEDKLNEDKANLLMPEEIPLTSVLYDPPPAHSSSSCTLDSEFAHRAASLCIIDRQVDIIQKQIILEEKNNENLQAQMKDVTDKMLKLKGTAYQQEERKSMLTQEIDNMNVKVGKAGVTGLLKEFLPLVQQQTISQHEKHIFQTRCEERHRELVETIQKLTTEIEDGRGGSNESDVEGNLETELLRLKLLKMDYAKICQKILSCHRKLDDLPCQAELMQYERCFIELYLNIQAKLLETRKYYASYNSLAEANELTTKEISLLNSINDQLEQTTLSHEGRKKFVESMSEIAKGTRQKLEKMEARLVREQNSLATLKEKHQTLVAERRQYFSMVKLFQDECSKNEALKRTSLANLLTE